MGVSVFVLELLAVSPAKCGQSFFLALRDSLIFTEVVFGTPGLLFMSPSLQLLKLHGQFLFLLHAGAAA